MEAQTSNLDDFAALDPAEQARRRSEVRVLVLTGLGLNCEAETEAAFRAAGASPERVHLLELLDGTAARRLPDYHVLAFIGGFSFGDHLGAGTVFANKIRSRLYDDLLTFVAKGGLSLGICNGFQTMTRLGLLPGLDGDLRTPRATLAQNDRPGYRDAWVKLGFHRCIPVRLDARPRRDGPPRAPRRGQAPDDRRGSRAPRGRGAARLPISRWVRSSDGGVAGESERVSRRRRRHV
jgi:hypothetical protein